MRLLQVVGIAASPCPDRLLRLMLKLMRVEGVSVVTATIQRQQGL
jgi:hypothetical protein